jgi:hypothetical protein
MVQRPEAEPEVVAPRSELATEIDHDQPTSSGILHHNVVVTFRLLDVDCVVAGILVDCFLCLLGGFIASNCRIQTDFIFFKSLNSLLLKM